MVVGQDRKTERVKIEKLTIKTTIAPEEKGKDKVKDRGILAKNESRVVQGRAEEEVPVAERN